MIVFLDCEASSLHHGSYPIEIGWCDVDGKGESHLIRPEPSWDDWSMEAERLHGLSMSQLHQEGEPAEVVARRVLAFLEKTGCDFYSDAPAFDGRWLNTLLHTCGCDVLRVPVLPVTNAYAQACAPLRGHFASERETRILAAKIVADAEEAEERLEHVRHRALPDAQGLAWTWREVRRRVREITGR